MWEPPATLPTVKDLLDAVDVTVQGLEEAKRRLCVVLRRHMVAAQNDRAYRFANILLIGGTGCGKTYMARELLSKAGVPWIDVNATQFSEVGYHGMDLSQMFADFWGPRWVGEGRRKDIIPLAERWGVVLIDEIDKWAYQPNLKERQSQRLLQAELLRFVEGESVRVKERDSEMGTPFRTDHLLFIGMGAFQSFGRLIDYRDAAARRDVDASAISRYGFLEELAGRFSSIIALPPLSVAQMLSILERQIWPEYVQQAEDEGVTLIAEQNALRRLADMAVQDDIGARALRPLCEAQLWKAWHQARPGGVIRLVPDHIPHGAIYEEAA